MGQAIRIPPEPLTQVEFDRLQGWERRMIRFYALATAAIVAAAALTFTYSDSPWIRRSMLAGVVGLMLAGAFVQFRERCPRCAARIGAQTRLVLPGKCKKCGVIFDGP